MTAEAEYQTWEILCATAGSLVLAPSGHVVGLDFASALTLAKARGYKLVASLYPAAAAGCVDGLNSTRKADTSDAN